ncbi:MAG: hypothetical protein UR68_C0001G0095 [Candidatus Roizmanbacteria bacterium GW2011_GWA2_35_19]|uniref:Uncharacterized protein n=2 Tax=Candidatus Roizmaniibacteriota TaxID=1752723 RepID=A0A0G0EGZ6_9BACT|nr:MAG: hypothetical protein UR63_C0012G0004 [Candidatus Roizmanbacteria bacterium GW2011_GWC2_35_12]KKP74495.1 MAG: hypothetical protein UR68_C0001G0095 [Candidatus Roizmanbacteria bacterium GW2011_GWA2_35_19]
MANKLLETSRRDRAAKLMKMKKNRKVATANLWLVSDFTIRLKKRLNKKVTIKMIARLLGGTNTISSKIAIKSKIIGVASLIVINYNVLP